MGLRAKQLNEISQQVPGQNQQITNGLNQAREAQFRQAAQQVVATPGAAQQLGAAAQKQRQSLAQQGVQSNLQQQQQLGQLEAQNTQLQNQQDLFTRQQGLQRKQRQLENQLANLGEETKSKIWDDNLKFEKDELGRTAFNDRQLLDYAIVNAKSDEDLANFEQQMNFESQKRMDALKFAQAKIKQTLQQGFDDYNQTLDNEQKIRLVQAQNALRQKLKEEENKRANRAAMFGAAGTVAGAVVGTVIAPGAGTAAGATIGGGLGTAAAGATNK